MAIMLYHPLIGLLHVIRLNVQYHLYLIANNLSLGFGQIRYLFIVWGSDDNKKISNKSNKIWEIEWYATASNHSSTKHVIGIIYHKRI